MTLDKFGRYLHATKRVKTGLIENSADLVSKDYLREYLTNALSGQDKSSSLAPTINALSKRLSTLESTIKKKLGQRPPDLSKFIDKSYLNNELDKFRKALLKLQEQQQQQLQNTLSTAVNKNYSEEISELKNQQNSLRERLESLEGQLQLILLNNNNKKDNLRERLESLEGQYQLILMNNNKKDAHLVKLEDELKQSDSIIRGIMNYTFNTILNKKRPVKGIAKQFYHTFKIGHTAYRFPLAKAKIIEVLSNQSSFTVKINSKEFADYKKLEGEYLNDKDLLYIYSPEKVEKIHLEMFLAYEYNTGI